MAMKNLDYDYCHAAPVLEWMSQKWALVAMMRIEEKSEDDGVAFHHIVASKGYRDNHQKIYSNHVEEKDI